MMGHFYPILVPKSMFALLLEPPSKDFFEILHDARAIWINKGSSSE